MNKVLSARYTAFALLYFSQGAILSYFTSLNAIYLLSFGLTMSQVGLFSSVALIPMILKIFIGMLSDKDIAGALAPLKVTLKASTLPSTTVSPPIAGAMSMVGTSASVM